MGKGEIARYEQFLLFPQGFLKTYTADTWKPGLVWERVNSLPDHEIFTLSNFKAIADDKLNIAKNIKFFFYMLENIVERGEHAGYHVF